VYVASNRPVHYAGRISGDLTDQVLDLEKQHSKQTIWIVGGPNLLEECVDILDEVHLTHFKGSYKIDTKIDLKMFLRGFAMTSASVAPDFKSTFVTYAPLFNRNTAST
jgi:dihydrofolate reductase